MISGLFRRNSGQNVVPQAFVSSGEQPHLVLLLIKLR